MTESILHWIDYLVLATFLAISLGIGIYHSLTGGRQKTTDEFIMANRSLSVLPTALSMMVSFQSAIAILGYTSEIYSYGTMYFIWPAVGFALSIVLAAVIFVPWIYPLKLVSVNEYFYLRFKSKLITTIAGVLSLAAGIIYMGVAMYAPSVALESVTGFPIVISVPLMAVVCIAYTTLGGMRAVIWTDVFQFFVMMGGILAIFIKGLMTVGGYGSAFELLAKQDRVNWIITTPDPRVRHTMWEFLIGATISGAFTYGTNQASVQRYSATRSMAQARLSILLNIPMLWCLGFMLNSIGLLVTAYYTSIGCDPIVNKQISSPNQLLPLFVTTLFSSNYGFSGMFLATLYGGALSSVSSSLSGGAANCWKDILKWKFSHLKESSQALITRLLVVVFGILATGVAFLAATVPGPIIQVSLSLCGSIAGPYYAMFLLGGLSKKSNFKGSLIGAFCGLSISIWLSMGAIMMKGKHPPLHPLPTTGCAVRNTTELMTYNYNSSLVYSEILQDTTVQIASQETQRTGLQHFYTVSYQWFLIVGLLTSIIVGFIASLFFRDKSQEEAIDDNLLIPWRKAITFCSGDANKDYKQSDELKHLPPVSLVQVYKLQDIQTPD